MRHFGTIIAIHNRQLILHKYKTMADTTVKPTPSAPSTPPVTTSKADLAATVAAKREAFIKKYAGEPKHNPFFFLNTKIAPLEVKLSKKLPLTDEEAKLLNSEWPEPLVD